MWHLGLGDSIICNGMVRMLAPMYELLCLPVKYHNCSSVEYMFRDLPNVVIRPVENDDELCFFANNVWKSKTLGLGCHSAQQFDGTNWDVEFYRHAGVEFSDRWEKFICPRDLKAEHNVAVKVLTDDLCGEYPVFIHEDTSRGIIINRNRINRNRTEGSNQPTMWIYPVRYSPILFHWRTVIECCDEIHCIPSSFAHFIDSIDLPKKPKKYLHVYTRPGEPPAKFKPDWEILT
jgi:hypothetical protein